MKTVNCFTAICCCTFCEVIAYSPAIISIDNTNNLRIIDQRNNRELEYFQVSIYQNPRKNENGSLQFALKIDFRNFNEKIRFNDEIIKNSNNGRIFYVEIPKNELKNEIFFKEIPIKSDNANYRLNSIRLKIEPKVEISADQKEVSFGKIFHNGVRVISENSPSVMIRYSVLKNAICEVTSKNNFRLKNNENYIPYSMNNLTENGKIDLPSDKKEYIANFKIANFKKKPTSGNYSDKITFSIKTHL